MVETKLSQKGDALVHVVEEYKIAKVSGIAGRRHANNAFRILFLSFCTSPGSAFSVLTPFLD